MSNVVEKTKQNNMHSHIEDSFKIIDEFLPSNYTCYVSEKLKSYDTRFSPSDRTIRNVKNKYDGFEKQILIIKALVEVALDNKKNIESLKELIKS
jgi:hypothetical protein